MFLLFSIPFRSLSNHVFLPYLLLHMCVLCYRYVSIFSSLTSVSFHSPLPDDQFLNSRMGFENECDTKYGRSMYPLCRGAFDLIPLCVIIQKKIFVVHGGLFEDTSVTLEEINRLDRTREKLNEREQTIFEGLLWSDPKNIQGCVPSRRGAGVEFGDDITARFLDNNGLTTLIRSHEMTQEGYLKQHNNRCITIFSASNYSERHTNLGGYIVYSSTELHPQIQSYMAEPLSTSMSLTPSTKNLDGVAGANEVGSSARNRSQKADVLQLLREATFENRHALLLAFQDVDKENKGTVSRMQWVKVRSLKLKIRRLARGDGY